MTTKISLRKKLTLMHAYLCSIDRKRMIDSSNPLTRKLFGISREITFAPLPHIARRTRRRVHAKTRRTRVVANLRNEAIARVVPSVRRAYARSLAVSTRDACQGRENKEMRESWNLSCSSRTTCSVVRTHRGRREPN